MVKSNVHLGGGVKSEQPPPKAVSLRTKTTPLTIATTRKTTTATKQRLTQSSFNQNPQQRPMKVGETNKKDTVPTALEFDLPPPPPSRFLPETEKLRISELIRQNQLLKNLVSFDSLNIFYS